MSKLTKSWNNKKEPQFDSSMLNASEMMEVDDKRYSSSNGEIVFRSTLGYISLNDGKVFETKVFGRKLLPGESITLTQE